MTSAIDPHLIIAVCALRRLLDEQVATIARWRMTAGALGGVALYEAVLLIGRVYGVD